MGDVKTIVAALDLETDSDAVLGRAVQLTTEHGARLVVAHVIEAPSLSGLQRISVFDQPQTLVMLSPLAAGNPLIISIGRPAVPASKQEKYRVLVLMRVKSGWHRVRQVF